MCTSVVRRTCSYAMLALALSVGLACGSDDSESSGHALEGTWEGHLFPRGTLTLDIDGSGEITEILLNGAPMSGIQGGSVDDGPTTYTMTWIDDALGPLAFPFLTDEEESHGAIALLFGPVAFVGAVERDGSRSTVFFESDIVGSWTGFGYAYEQSALDFQPFSPVTAEATAGTPIAFSVTMRSGTLTGIFPDFANLFAFWGGTAGVSGAEVFVVMSPDKQFVAVEVVPPGYQNLEDLTFFALNRDP